MSIFDNFPPADMARCINANCSVRDSCIRWQSNSDRNARSFMSGKGGPDCDNFINDGSHIKEEQ